MLNNISIIILSAFPDKKIKSIGNKSLIKIYKNRTLLEHQIFVLQKTYKNPEIIVVGSFEGKKINKLIKGFQSNYNIRYVEHSIEPTFNISKSIKEGLRVATHNKLLIQNSSIILHKKAIMSLKNTKSSFLLCSKKTKGHIGYVENNSVLVNCFFDIGNNTAYDLLYLSEYDGAKLKHLCTNNTISDNMYLFEMVNACIANDISITPIDISEKQIKVIDSLSSINHIQKNIKNYV